MTYRLQSLPEKSSVLLDSKGETYKQRSSSSWLLGIVSAAIAFPLIVLAIAFSVFLPQEKWEEFWDKFLEA